ncbi:MAG: efflux RND transporter periplasmic adaptor subunit [Candidatus Acidiferrales bacterium]
MGASVHTRPGTEEGASGPMGPSAAVSKRMGPKHWLWILLALAIIAAIVIFGVLSRSRAEGELKKDTATLAVPTVSIIHAERSAPQQEIVLPANIQAYSDAPIYARTNGYLKHWYVDIGAHVKKGELLADIDTPEVDQQLQQARSDLSTAEANHHIAQITANRYQGLLNSESVAKQDVDNAVANMQATQTQVQAAQDNVKRVEDLQSFEKIYAPFDGVITARNIDVGDLINAGSAGPAQELFHISAINKLRVYVSVPQIYSAAARPGTKAYLILPEFPSRKFPGTLVRTANAITPASRTLLIEVDVNNSSGTLLPGAYAEVHIGIPGKASTYIVPIAALIFRSQGIQLATVDDGKHAKLVSVTLGRDFGTRVEVVSGATDQDSIIVNPPDSLVDGEEVRINAQTTPSQPSGSPEGQQ